jgi:hypothetical protein
MTRVSQVVDVLLTSSSGCAAGRAARRLRTWWMRPSRRGRESNAPDDITWLISLIEAVSPNFDRASLDGPRQ